MSQQHPCSAAARAMGLTVLMLGLLAPLPGCVRSEREANVETSATAEAHPPAEGPPVSDRRSSEPPAPRAGPAALRLIESAVYGDVEGVRFALEAGVPPDSLDATNHTALHAAARNGHAEIAQMLIEHGASVNRPGRNGLMPLHFAARMGHIEVVRILLESGAEVNPLTNAGLTPMNFSVGNRYHDVTELLAAHGGVTAQ